MHMFSQGKSTRLLTSLQVYRVHSLSQQHHHGSHKMQIHTNRHPQVPTFRLVPCPPLLNTVPTHSAPDETQRVAKIHVHLPEMMSATIPSQWNVLHPLMVVPSAQRNETMLTSVRPVVVVALKAASSHEPNQYPYTACNPSASSFALWKVQSLRGASHTSGIRSDGGPGRVSCWRRWRDTHALAFFWVPKSAAPMPAFAFLHCSHSVETLASRSLKKEKGQRFNNFTIKNGSRRQVHITNHIHKREHIRPKNNRSTHVHTHSTPVLPLISRQSRSFLLQTLLTNALIHTRRNSQQARLQTTATFSFPPSSSLFPLLLASY